MAIGGNTALDPFRKPATNLQREGSLAFRDRSSSLADPLGGQKRRAKSAAEIRLFVIRKSCR